MQEKLIDDFIHRKFCIDIKDRLLVKVCKLIPILEEYGLYPFYDQNLEKWLRECLYDPYPYLFIDSDGYLEATKIADNRFGYVVSLDEFLDKYNIIEIEEADIISVLE